MSSKGVYPESMISYPKPSEKMAEVREGGGEGEGREKSLSLSRGEKVLK